MRRPYGGPVHLHLQGICRRGAVGPIEPVGCFCNEFAASLPADDGAGPPPLQFLWTRITGLPEHIVVAVSAKQLSRGGRGNAGADSCIQQEPGAWLAWRNASRRVPGVRRCPSSTV